LKANCKPVSSLLRWCKHALLWALLLLLLLLQEATSLSSLKIGACGADM
jgi:hypothetical protein